MKKLPLAMINGIMNISASILLFVWWILLGIIIVSSGSLNASSEQIVNLKYYQAINLVGLLACYLSPIALLGLFIQNHHDMGMLGLIGLLLSCVGISLFGSLQFEETITWPILARRASDLLDQKTGLFSDPTFMQVYIFMGVVLGLGFLIFGIALLRVKAYPKWSEVLFLVGSVIFATIASIPFRSIGIILFAIGWIAIGYKQLKSQNLA